MLFVENLVPFAQIIAAETCAWARQQQYCRPLPTETIHQCNLRLTETASHFRSENTIKNQLPALLRGTVEGGP